MDYFIAGAMKSTGTSFNRIYYVGIATGYWFHCGFYGSRLGNFPNRNYETEHAQKRQYRQKGV